jgi:hypothetical protein
MANPRGWFLQDVEQLAVTDPAFFRHPLRTAQDRAAVRLGEVVKLAVRVADEGGSLLYARWAAVTEVAQASPHCYVGRLEDLSDDGLRPPGGGDTLAFGPEHVYRLEPREFAVWGNHGVPVTMSGGDQRPEREDGSPWPGCHEIIARFRAESGWPEAMEHYARLAEANSGWPSADELGNCGG